MEVWVLALFLLLGGITGAMSGFFGIGGGMVIVPTMLVLGHSYDSAVGISILQMACSSVVGSFANFKKGLLDVKIGVWVGLGGMVGASFSGLILASFSHKTLLGAFIVVTLYSFVRFVFKSKATPLESKEPFILSAKHKALLLGIGALTGVFAISLGIGGGVLMVPLLAYYLKIPAKQSVPLGLFFVIFSSFSGVISLARHSLLDFEDLQWGLMVGLGSVGGVILGVRLVPLVPALWHRRALLSVYTCAITISIYKWF
ncbi:sulfite exporter TauE/SafE family protein [Helicobacter labacensis]|uniref:sulfite exporter TauE/SafE family protein n=1 Tax=Helicobacter labacensis TaxID=2316079 RepID=UPI000EABC670|nr:sulfite exporter TauE/SafE family protein [Helicobacter labacensis]